MVQSCGPPRRSARVPLTMNFPLGRVHKTRRGCPIQYSLHTCRLAASRLPRVCDRDVECVCATMLRPIWRALNLYRFPFPGLCYSISGAAPCNQCNPLHLHHATPFLPLTARPSKRRSRTANERVVCVRSAQPCALVTAIRQSLPKIWSGFRFGSCDRSGLAA